MQVTIRIVALLLQYVKTLVPRVLGQGRKLEPRVFPGVHADAPAKYAGKVVGVGEAAGVGYELHRVLSLPQEELRVFNAHLVEVFSRRHADILAEAAREIFLAHLKSCRKLPNALQKGVVPAQDAEGRLHHRGHGAPSRGALCAGAAERHQKRIGAAGGFPRRDLPPSLREEGPQRPFGRAAAALEKAGDDGNTAKIKSDTPKLFALYKACIDAIKPAMDDGAGNSGANEGASGSVGGADASADGARGDDRAATASAKASGGVDGGSGAKATLSPEEIAEVYDALKEIASSFDYDSVTFVLDDLKGKQPPADEKAHYNAVIKAAKKPDWETLKKLLEEGE